MTIADTKAITEMTALRQWSPHATEQLLRAKGTPVLLMNQAVLRLAYEEIRREFPTAKIHYALKANPDRRVARFLAQLGVGFEIASTGELKMLLALGVTPERIISSNTLKTPHFVRAAHAAGIALFAFDSQEEIQKLSQKAPGSQVCIRLTVSNEGSEWPLSRKFGVESEQAIELLLEAKRSGLQPVGLTFHVGSQCTNPQTWVKALEKSRELWEAMAQRGIVMKVLNIGGGFPVRYTKPVPSTADVADAIKQALSRLFPEDIELIIEPGRVLVGEAGILATSVIAKAVRDGKSWLYLDVGVFNGLMESIGGIRYPMAAARNGSSATWMLAGPSCDSMDTISSEVILPELEIGDIVYIMSAGAYTTAYASKFNGFTMPKIVLV